MHHPCPPAVFHVELVLAGVTLRLAASLAATLRTMIVACGFPNPTPNPLPPGGGLQPHSWANYWDCSTGFIKSYGKRGSCWGGVLLE